MPLTVPACDSSERLFDCDRFGLPSHLQACLAPSARWPVPRAPLAGSLYVLFMTSSGLGYTTFSLPLPSTASPSMPAAKPTLQAVKLALSQYAPDDVMVTFAAGTGWTSTLLSGCTLQGSGEIGCGVQLTSYLTNAACPSLSAGLVANGSALIAAGKMRTVCVVFSPANGYNWMSCSALRIHFLFCAMYPLHVVLGCSDWI